MSTDARLIETHGSVAPGFDEVLAEFRRNFTDRGERGAALAVVVDGVMVVDLWGGQAHSAAGRAWTETTLVPIFSGTKGLVATCLARLLEHGRVSLDAPVCEYWPEFAQKGKSEVLVRHVVSHESGLPGLTTPVSVLEATDDVKMASLLAAQLPTGRPGRWQAYHAMTFGWLCGELIRRVTGASVGRYFAREIAEPLQLEAWIGLPDREEPRVAAIRLEHDFNLGDYSTRDHDKQTTAACLGWSIWSNPPRFADGLLAANTRAWHAAEIPATNGIAAPRSLARLYSCLARGGAIDGVEIMTASTIAKARSRLGGGWDPFLNSEMAFGTGFQLQTASATFGPERDGFGHAGVGGSVHGAWPALKTGFSYATNLLQSSDATDLRLARCWVHFGTPSPPECK